MYLFGVPFVENCKKFPQKSQLPRIKELDILNGLSDPRLVAADGLTFLL
jgi:hypothetical protein